MGVRQDRAAVRAGRSAARGLGLRKKHRVTVVSVKPQGKNDYTHAGNDTVLSYGCEIVIAGRPDDVERFVDRQ